MYKINPKIAFFIILSFSVLVLSSCEDNPASPEFDEDHADAFGFELLMDGEVLVHYLFREYTLDPDGHFTDFVEDDRLVFDTSVIGGNVTNNITKRYLDEEGEPFTLPEYEQERNGLFGEWYITFRFFNPGTSTDIPIEERPLSEIYDRFEDTWVFAFDLSHSGEVDLRLDLFHIDHEDLTPRPLRIEVRANESDSAL